MHHPARRWSTTSVSIAACLLTAAAVVGGCSGVDGMSAGGTSGAQKSAPEGARPPAVADENAAGDAAGDAKGGSAGSPARATDITVRAIIRTANLVVRTKGVQAAADRATALVEGGDGYVSSQQSTADPTTDKAKVTSVNLVLRVPVDDFDRVTAGIRKLGTVLADKRDANDVTEEVVDVESRVKSQKRSIERLRTLLGQANTVGEVMQVESELANREAELESLQGRFEVLSSQTSLSTIRVTFEAPPAGPSPETEEAGGFLGGLRAGWDALLNVVQGLLTAVGAVMPFLAALALLLWLPAWLLLRARARRRTAATTTPSTS